MKVTGCLFVCLYVSNQKISLTTEPIWFSLAVKSLTGKGKVYSHFWEGTLNLLNKYRPSIFFQPHQPNPFLKYPQVQYHRHNLIIRIVLLYIVDIVF